MDDLNNLIFNKKIGLILYARMSSKRFPGKVLKKIYDNKNILQIIFNNLKRIKAQDNLIVATSNLSVDKEIIKFCKINKIKYFSGNHKNVFLRTKMCLKKYDLKYFVRICGDRPFFDVTLMKKMLKRLILGKYDIVTNSCPRTYPKGLTCEVAKSKLFEQINIKKISQNDKEHIFDYFYRSKKHNIYNVKSNFKKKFINENFCIDIKSDIKRIRNIFYLLKKKKKRISAKNLEKLLKF